MNFGPGGTSARSEVHTSSSLIVLDITTGEIAESFHALKQLIHCLLAHPGTLCKLARTRAIRAGILQYPHMWETQIAKASAV